MAQKIEKLLLTSYCLILISVIKPNQKLLNRKKTL